MPPNTPRARRKKIGEALDALCQLDLPREQQNDRSALTLLALLNLKPAQEWGKASGPLMGVTPIMKFMEREYGNIYAPNTRETIRRFTIHQFVQAGLAMANPDAPDRPVNSPKTVYQIESSALLLLRSFGTAVWGQGLQTYLSQTQSLRARYAHDRSMQMVPVGLAPGKEILLTPGGQNDLIKAVIEQFCPRFTPGATVVYVGDTGQKWAYVNTDLLATLCVDLDEHGKMPDILVHLPDKNWLVLVEAVTSHGPVSPKRHAELTELMKGSRAGLVFVTAFENRQTMARYLTAICWETEVWVADAPSHLIHFNGPRFLGPY